MMDAVCRVFLSYDQGLPGKLIVHALPFWEPQLRRCGADTLCLCSLLLIAFDIILWINTQSID